MARFICGLTFTLVTDVMRIRHGSKAHDFFLLLVLTAEWLAIERCIAFCTTSRPAVRLLHLWRVSLDMQPASQVVLID